MLFLCSHQYESFKEIVNCEKTVFISKCKKCGRLKSLEVNIVNHQWEYMGEENIVFNRNCAIKEKIHVFICKKCKKMRQERVGI